MGPERRPRHRTSVRGHALRDRLRQHHVVGQRPGSHGGGPGRGGGRLRVVLDRRARRLPRRLRVDLPLQPRRQDARDPVDADPGPAHLAGLRGRRPPPRCGWPPASSSSPSATRWCWPRSWPRSTTCRAGGSSSASGSAGCARSSTPSACPGSGAAPAPTSTSAAMRALWAERRRELRRRVRVVLAGVVEPEAGAGHDPDRGRRPLARRRRAGRPARRRLRARARARRPSWPR